MNKKSHTNCNLMSEFLFTILPLIVVLIIRISNEEYKSIFYNTEWAFIAVLLYGQTLVKLASGGTASKGASWQGVAMITTVVIVFGLVPSIVILCVNFTAVDKSFGMHIFQMIELIGSIGAFFIVGGVGDDMKD